MNNEIVGYVSQIDEILKINEFLDEKFVDQALNDLVKLAVKPDLPVATVRILIVKLQAISGTCALRATYYTAMAKGRSGSDEYIKKNLYYSLADVFDKIVAALKYLARDGV